MAYEGVKVRDIVDRAVSHSWSIPEFQRGFVWKATQVRDLLESLWLDYRQWLFDREELALFALTYRATRGRPPAGLFPELASPRGRRDDDR